MKPLILKEYDKIIRDTLLDKETIYVTNSNGTVSLCAEYFDALKNILLKRGNQEEGKEELRGSIVNFLKLANHRQHGEILQIQHYVGIIELSNGFQIEALPKIDIKESLNKEQETAALEQILLRMLGYLKDFPAIPSDMANIDTRKTSLYEVFIQLYLGKVERLIRHGLRYQYVSIEENLPSFKGRLNVTKQLRYNGAKKQYFYITHDEYLLDSPENRLIKSTLLYLSDKSENNANSKLARQLLEAFENVPDSTDFLGDYGRISYDRFNNFYHDVIEWSIAFLLGKSFVISQGSTVADSLFFPMEKIFEAFIGKQLAKCLRDNQKEFPKWKLKTQSTKKFLFDDPKKFQIKPDIRIYRGSGLSEENIIFDTKWKKLDPSGRSRNYGISTADMYQMYAYAKRYKANDVWLLYPDSRGEESIKTRKYKTTTDLYEESLKWNDQHQEIKLDANVTVHLEFIDLSVLSEANYSTAMKHIETELKSLLERGINTGSPNNEKSSS